MTSSVLNQFKKHRRIILRDDIKRKHSRWRINYEDTNYTFIHRDYYYYIVIYSTKITHQLCVGLVSIYGKGRRQNKETCASGLHLSPNHISLRDTIIYITSQLTTDQTLGWFSSILLSGKSTKSNQTKSLRLRFIIDCALPINVESIFLYIY